MFAREISTKAGSSIEGEDGNHRGTEGGNARRPEMRLVFVTTASHGGNMGQISLASGKHWKNIGKYRKT